VSIVDHHGREIVRSTVEHNAAGLRELLAVLERAGVREVAIERPDGPVVDTLLDAGVTVVVISPNQVKNLRGRYGSAGNKDDRFDAFVLADTLRTDRARLHPLLPDTAATVALRQTCRARKDLVAHRVAVANQLRAHLKIVFPGAVGLFADLDSPISLAFLTRFDCQDRADWLSVKRLTAWLASVGYSGRTDPSVLHRRLTSAPHGTAGTDGAATTAAFVAVLSSLVTQIKALDTDIAEQLARHADAQIFTALPRSGTVRAARLLSEIGDCRARFPAPESLACLAGVAPSTRQSGKSNTSVSVGPQTSSSATRSPTSPATADTPTPGLPTYTTAPSPADTTTPMRSASSPAPGSTSSGTAGKTKSPTTPPNIAPSRHCSTTNTGRLDTGLLMPAHPRARTVSAIDVSNSTSSASTPRATHGMARAGADRAGVDALRTRNHPATPRCCSTPSPNRHPSASPHNARRRNCS
jgi:transposase